MGHQDYDNVTDGERWIYASGKRGITLQCNPLKHGLFIKLRLILKNSDENQKDVNILQIKCDNAFMISNSILSVLSQI